MNLKKLLVTLSFLALPCFVVSVFAQLPPSVGAPIDGGVSGLLIAAGLYGARKVYKSRKKAD